MFLSLTAEKQTELAMLAANTLTLDLSSHLPIVRALALRTIVRMDIESLTQHLAVPLQQSLSDEDPYVRKTAALCVAKLSLTQGTWLKEFGFVDRLREMLNDANVAVLVNVVSALMEAGGLDVLEYALVSSLLAALSEANEWGKVSSCTGGYWTPLEGGSRNFPQGRGGGGRNFFLQIFRKKWWGLKNGGCG